MSQDILPRSTLLLGERISQDHRTSLQHQKKVGDECKEACYDSPLTIHEENVTQLEGEAPVKVMNCYSKF